MIDTFIARWTASGAAERANFQPFVGELAGLLGLEPPEPSRADDALNSYVYERAVSFRNPNGSTSPGRIDLYKRDCFVMEGKQGGDAGIPRADTGGRAGAICDVERLKKTAKQKWPAEQFHRPLSIGSRAFSAGESPAR